MSGHPSETGTRHATREAAIKAAGKILAAGIDAQDQRTVEEAATAAWTPTGPSLSELRERIAQQRRERGLA